MRVKSRSNQTWSAQASKPVPKLERYVYLHSNHAAVTVFETFTPEQARELALQLLVAAMNAEVPDEVIAAKIQKAFKEMENNE